jgi:hypothetical protein
MSYTKFAPESYIASDGLDVGLGMFPDMRVENLPSCPTQPTWLLIFPQSHLQQSQSRQKSPPTSLQVDKDFVVLQAPKRNTSLQFELQAFIRNTSPQVLKDVMDSSQKISNVKGGQLPNSTTPSRKPQRYQKGGPIPSRYPVSLHKKSRYISIIKALKVRHGSRTSDLRST